MNNNTLNTLSPLPALSANMREPTFLQVCHTTAYRYPGQASLAYNRAWLEPVNLPDQQLVEHKLSITPKPQFQHSQIDSFGNQVSYFEVHSPHDQLSVVSEAIVARILKPQDAHCAKSWETVQFNKITDRQRQIQLCPFAYPSLMAPYNRAVQEYTALSFSKKRPVAEALFDFACRIHADFTYDPQATQVETTLEEFWELRKGVCQDFSHFAVSGLRSLGLVAAYVSGYVMTYPPEGEEKRLSADASHAWIALFVPGFGWLHVDPTNKMWVNDEHIIVALGRDYTDIPPLKGVCYGAGQQQPEVAVQMRRICPEELP